MGAKSEDGTSSNSNKLLARAVTSLSSQITEVNRTVLTLLDRVSVLSAQFDTFHAGNGSASASHVRRSASGPVVIADDHNHAHDARWEKDSSNGGGGGGEPRKNRISFGATTRVVNMLAHRRHAHSDSGAAVAVAGANGHHAQNGVDAAPQQQPFPPRSDETVEWTESLRMTKVTHANGFGFSIPREVQGLPCHCERPPTDLYSYNPGGSGWVLNRNVPRTLWSDAFTFGAAMEMCWMRFTLLLAAAKASLVAFFAVLHAAGAMSAWLRPAAGVAVVVTATAGTEAGAAAWVGHVPMAGFGRPLQLLGSGIGGGLGLLGDGVLAALQMEEWSWTAAVGVAQATANTVYWLVVAGLLFSKMSRPCNPMVLADKICVAAVLGKPTLVTRVFISRSPFYILDCRVQLTWVRLVVDEITREPFQKHDDLEVERPAALVFDFMKVIRHIIDERSPLYGKTFPQLVATQSVFRLSVLGRDPATGNEVAAVHAYRATDCTDNSVFFGRQFEPFFRGMAALPPEVRVAGPQQDSRVPPLPETVPVLDLAGLSRLQGDGDGGGDSVAARWLRR